MSPAPARARRKTAGAPVAAAVLPIARVAVDVSLAHLDRTFDYLVADPQADAAQPGTRVRVRFAGRLLDGYLLERVAQSDHDGRLGFLEKVVSPEPVLTPQVARLARVVADRCAGSMADVLRLAVPPRHARVETAPPATTPERTPGELSPLTPHRSHAPAAAGAFLDAGAHGRPVRAVWQALPGEDWPARLAEAAATARAAGRG